MLQIVISHVEKGKGVSLFLNMVLSCRQGGDCWIVASIKPLRLIVFGPCFERSNMPMHIVAA